VNQSLRACGLNDGEAFPFDHIVSDFASVIRCFGDGFASFMVPPTERVRRGDISFPIFQGGGLAFSHFDLRSAAVVAKFAERCQRLEAFLRATTVPVVFVRSVLYADDVARGAEFMWTVRRRFPALRFGLLFIAETVLPQHRRAVAGQPGLETDHLWFDGTAWVIRSTQPGTPTGYVPVLRTAAAQLATAFAPDGTGTTATTATTATAWDRLPPSTHLDTRLDAWGKTLLTTMLPEIPAGARRPSWRQRQQSKDVVAVRTTQPPDPALSPPAPPPAPPR
jgi:hypothetical protein